MAKKRKWLCPQMILSTLDVPCSTIRRSDISQASPCCVPQLFVILLFNLGFRDDLLLHVRGDDVVVAEFHRIAALATGHA